MMTRSADEILHDIESFLPDDGNWLRLDDLLAELWDSELPPRAFKTLFAVFERFPDDDGAGVLWSIVHGIESLDVDYEPALRDLIARNPSLMGRTMLDRLERAKSM